MKQLNSNNIRLRSSVRSKKSVAKKFLGTNSIRLRLRQSALSNKLITKFVIKDKVIATTKKILLEKNS